MQGWALPGEGSAGVADVDMDGRLVGAIGIGGDAGLLIEWARA